MVRVARRRIVIVAFDPEALEDLWIVANYFPQMLGLERPPGAGSRDLAAEAAGGGDLSPCNRDGRP
jgi:hypothetical protein